MRAKAQPKTLETKPRHRPGHDVPVPELPSCDFCRDGTEAHWDFRTKMGPWANGCDRHFEEHRVSANTGVGFAQRLFVR